MVILEYVPEGYDEIVEYYGNPDPQGDGNFDPVFWNKHMKRFQLPYPMRIGWEPDRLVESFWMHEKVGDATIDALKEAGRYLTGDFKHMERSNLNHYWGTFAFRFMRGYDKYSTHSWGIAIDINKHLGELGEEPQMPEFIVEAFERRGFTWGGRWVRQDGMHFQACKGY